PVPDFANWLDRERKAEGSVVLSADDRAALSNLERKGWWLRPEIRDPVHRPLLHAAAWYFLHARNSRGMPLDSVARFHLGNGARLERINWLADTSENGLAQSYGLMVNYLYDLEHIEENHEAYAGSRTIVTSKPIKRLARKPGAGPGSRSERPATRHGRGEASAART